MFCAATMKTNMVRHLKNKHRIAFVEFLRMNNKDPVKKGAEEIGAYPKKSIFWCFFKEFGQKLRCKLCQRTLSNNPTMHLKSRHPEEYNQLANSINNVKTIIEPATSRGWVKKYCIVVDGGCKCDLCHKVLKVGRNHYYNMKRHIQAKHPYVYASETKSAQVQQVFCLVRNDSEYVLKHLEATKIASEKKDTIKKRNTDSKTESDDGSSDTSSDEVNVKSKVYYNHELKDKIKMLCKKVVPAKCQDLNEEGSNQTDFEILEDGSYKCKKCDILIEKVENELALFNHVQECHSQRVFKGIVGTLKDDQDSDEAADADDSITEISEVIIGE